MFWNDDVFCRRYWWMQQQSLFEWSNVYGRCELVHLWLCRWLHRNTLRDRFVLDNDVNCSPYADHLNDNFIFSSLSVNYLKQAGLTLKRPMHYHPVLNSFIWMQISTNAAAILVWMEQHVLTLSTRTLVAVLLVTRERTARQVRPWHWRQIIYCALRCCTQNNLLKRFVDMTQKYIHQNRC